MVIMENHFKFKDGHVFVNGTEIAMVTDIDIHPLINKPAQIQLSFKAMSLDVEWSKLPRQ
jgi:hypothetical protein